MLSLERDLATAAFDAVLGRRTVDIAVEASDCYAMSKSKSLTGQAKLLALKLAGASRDQIETQARKQRNGTPAVVVGRIKCPLPSGTVVQVRNEKITQLERRNGRA